MEHSPETLMLLFAAIFTSIALLVIGGGIAFWTCSRHTWCPYYLRRQLNSWYKTLEKRNAKKTTKVARIPTPPEGGEAA